MRIVEEIPTSEAVRQRLVAASAEEKMLRQLLRLAQRKEREEERLARLLQPLPSGGQHRAD